MTDATLSVDILTDVDRSMLMRSAKEAKETFEATLDMGGGLKIFTRDAEEAARIIEEAGLKARKEQFIDADTGETRTRVTAGAADTGGGMRGLPQLLGTIVRLLGPIGIAAGIIAEWRPLMRMIHGITKLLSATLQPIADIFMVMLMPIFGMLRPIVTAMRTLMAPFRRVAMELASTGQQLIAGGDFSAGMEMITTSIQALILPAITILTTEVLRLATNIILSQVEQIVMMIFDVVSPVLRWFRVPVDEARQHITGGFDTIKSGANDFIDWVQKSALTGIGHAIDGQIDDIENRWQHLEGVAPGEITRINDLLKESDDEILSLQNTTFDLFELADKRLNDLLDKLREPPGALLDRGIAEQAYSLRGKPQELMLPDFSGVAGSITRVAEDEMSSVRRVIQDTDLKALWLRSIGNPAAMLGNFLGDVVREEASRAENVLDPLKRAAEDMDVMELWTSSFLNPTLLGFKALKAVTDEYMGNSIIPDQFERGMLHMNRNVSTGFSNMEQSFTQFSKASNDTAAGVERAVSRLLEQKRRLEREIERTIRERERYAQASATMRAMSSSRSL